MEVQETLLTAAKAYGKNFRVTENEARRSSQKEAEAQAAQKSETVSPDRGAVLKRIVEPVERFVSRIGVEIKFHIHEETGEMQAEVRDSAGEKVIRKIPDDEVLRLAASIKEMSDHFLNRAL